MRTETCCEVVTNNNNKTYSCDCWCIFLSDSYVYVTQQDEPYSDKIRRSAKIMLNALFNSVYCELENKPSSHSDHSIPTDLVTSVGNCIAVTAMAIL
jgi:hypothetical protein